MREIVLSLLVISHVIVHRRGNSKVTLRRKGDAASQGSFSIQVHDYQRYCCTLYLRDGF